MAEYRLSAPAEDIYSHLAKKRQQVIDTGRRMAELTIPSVFPPEGYEPGDNIATTNQSFNALCVNTLASKLMFMALSPVRPMLRFQIIEHRLQKEYEQEPQLWSMVQVGLSKLEIEHRQRMEATTSRSAYVQACKALLVGGNILWEHMDINHPVVHLPPCYVTKRNTKGQPLLSILAQKVDVEDLDADVRDLVYKLDPDLQENPNPWEHQVTIYRVCKLCKDDGGKPYWEYWEEFKGELIPGTEMEANYEEPPLYPAWLIPVYGSNWGRSYCEEYRGDLHKIDQLESALNDGAAVASILWLFLNPGSRTSLRQLKKADNLSLMVGKGDDISIGPTLDRKQSDFQFVLKNVEETVRRLGRAFLLMSSIQRDAERVTAEEWAKMGQEIDEAMGGLYSELGQSFQQHVVRRFVALHHAEDHQLPKLPEGIFRVAIISALDAMGRALEGEVLVKATATLLEMFKEEAGRRIDIGEVIRRVYTSASVPQQGLVKSEDQVLQERTAEMKQAMTQELVSRGAGPAISAIGHAAPQMLTQVQQARQGDQPEAPPPDVAPPT